MPQVLVYPTNYPNRPKVAEADELLRHTGLRNITDDLPQDVIGEAVTESANKAWKAGIDPTTVRFIVEFS
jgi:hypothetical protein